MKITEKQLNRIIKEFYGVLDAPAGTVRAPELEAILDAAQSAHESKNVSYAELKDFFWTLNSVYANDGKIMEITRSQLRSIIKESLVSRRQEVKARVDELMKSRLFSSADKEDKAEAWLIIFDTIMNLERNGGSVRWDEEYMEDAFRPHSELKEKLALAAAESGPGYWMDALVSWSNGHKDYEDWL